MENSPTVDNSMIDLGYIKYTLNKSFPIRVFGMRSQQLTRGVNRLRIDVNSGNFSNSQTQRCQRRQAGTTANI